MLCFLLIAVNELQPTFAIAVKAFIVNSRHQLLLIKRPDTAVHKPGVWEIPGGRLEEGEDPFLGLKREVLEEVGLDISITGPLSVHHFVRDDGQKITMLVFVCTPFNEAVKLSSEHTHFKWLSLDEAAAIISKDFKDEIGFYKKRFLK